MIFQDFQRAVNMDIRAGVTQLASLQKPHEDFLYANINEWLTSDVRKLMLTAQDYYKNDNDIKDRKRYYIDRRGVKQEVTNLSNSKLTHPFMRKLTNQKVNYLLSKELSMQSDDEKFNDLVSAYIDRKFLKMLKNVGKDAIVNGIAWLQIYYNEKGELKFKRIPSEEIIPFWADADHTILEGIMRVYSIIRYLPDGVQREIKKVEYHTTQGVWYYEMGDKGLKPDSD
ncbi:MAG TPA: phage portal protein, partial [Tissierellaceae bacterium]|nr:phage portal protein [Tissierellaceae bacterium]